MMYYNSEKTEIEEVSALKFESYKKVTTPSPVLKRVSLDCEAVSILKISDNFEQGKKPSILKKKGSMRGKERSCHLPELQSILKKPAVERSKTQNGSPDFYPILKCRSLDDSTQLHIIELKPILKKRNSAEELKSKVVGEQRPIMKKKCLLGDDVEEKPKSILKNRARSQEESDIKKCGVTRPRSDSEPGIRSILKKSTFEDEPVKPLSILRSHFSDSSVQKTSFDNLFVENKLPSILKNPSPLCHQRDDEKTLSEKGHLQNLGLKTFEDVEHPQSILKHRSFFQDDVPQTQPVLKKDSKDYS
ncbi:uncharacterized protein LOC143233531 [Tachypleus tridentatus]|uniref:uncharacterized protein LOC143233531 n=1 Tax=Tachypleus tridentatus TaxID=6853 RepID=UPI003FD0CE84